VAELTGSLGKDPSLTGRTTLWRLAFASILHRPILGYGYAAFWGHNQQLAYRIREQSNWLDAPHSHNGYIETLLAFGGVGLVLVLFVYIRQLILAIRNAIQDRSSYAIWPVLFTIFFITYQFDEALLIGGNSVFWISFATASMYLGGTRSAQVFHTEGASLSDSTGASRWRSRRDDGPAAQPLA
jgi:O-antigen ligase